jgi:parvulin-like peptidyl-prolyl isomerase
MTKAFSISQAEIIEQVKLSCQIPTVLESIIFRKIIASAAQEMGIRVETSDLQQAADQIRWVNRLQKAENTWNWLQTHHLSLDDFEVLAQANLLAAKLAQALFGERVAPFFAEHRLDYMQIALYEIILADEDLAIELFYAIEEQEISFREVAEQYIPEPELRRTGGYRGVVSRTSLAPELSAAIFSVTPPQLLKPIATSKGIHLIKVEEFIEPQLDQELHSKIMSDLFTDWLKQQATQIEVAVLLAHIPLVEGVIRELK